METTGTFEWREGTGSGNMSTEHGYSITTYRFRLRCGHPEWLRRTQELYDGVVKFYYDLFLGHEELWESNSQEVLRSLEYLSLPGKEKRKPSDPLPYKDLPPYFRRAAINSGIAAAKSYLTRKRDLGISAGNAQEIQTPVVYYSRMYREFTSEHISLRVWDGERWNWLGCRLSGREFPSDARVLSPSVVLEGPYLMLHVPVREPVQDISPLKKRLGEGGNICGVQFSNGDAFAVASVFSPDGGEVSIRFFNGGREYSHHCRKVLEKIDQSKDSLGDLPEGPANKKYWMHLKHLREYYAHRVSREIVRFCEENQVSIIVLPQYQKDYSWKVMKGCGNWSPLHLSFRIRSYLRYKAWQSGILVVESYAGEAARICFRCGQPLVEDGWKTGEAVCCMGHRGNSYLNTARNLAATYRRQLLEKDSGEKTEKHGTQ